MVNSPGHILLPSGKLTDIDPENTTFEVVTDLPTPMTARVYVTWWLIPLSKWVITPVINGISRVNPLIGPEECEC